MIKKTVSIKLKSVDESGVVEAIAATYDKDSVGDKIVPGAFEKTLKDWKDAGKSLPFIWSHDHNNPMAYVGTVTEAKETDAGLYIKAQMDMDEPFAAKVYSLMKSGRVSNLSFAYEVKDGEFVQQKNDEGVTTDTFYSLKELKLFEVGPCLVGANQNTSVLGAKSDRDAMISKPNVVYVWTDVEVKEALMMTERVLTTGSYHLDAEKSTLEKIHGILQGLGISCQGQPEKSDESQDKDDELKAKSDDLDSTRIKQDLDILMMSEDY